MELSALAQNRAKSITREVELDVAGQPMTMTIRPLGMSPATQLRLLRADQRTGSEGMVEMSEVLPLALSEIVVSWDVSIDGVPVKPTAKVFSQLPFETLQLLFTIIGEAVNSVPFVTE